MKNDKSKGQQGNGYGVFIKAAATILSVGLTLFGFFYESQPAQNQNQNYVSEIPILPEFTYFQLFFFDQKKVIENQYNATNFSKFSLCSFEIKNTQFKSSELTPNVYKEVVLYNISQKDIIVISTNNTSLIYNFLPANVGYSTINPANGMLKFYAGKEPQSRIEGSNFDGTGINFRFGNFTQQDSLLLAKEFDLESIGPTSSCFILYDDDEIVNIKSWNR